MPAPWQTAPGGQVTIKSPTHPVGSPSLKPVPVTAPLVTVPLLDPAPPRAAPATPALPLVGKAVLPVPAPLVTPALLPPAGLPLPVVRPPHPNARSATQRSA